jgi:hypothetical protein
VGGGRFSSNTLHTIALSGLLGICLSLTGFVLNERISATSIMVANNVNKVSFLFGEPDQCIATACPFHSHASLSPCSKQFIVIIASEMFVQHTLDVQATLGATTVILFGIAYAHSRV